MIRNSNYKTFDITFMKRNLTWGGLFILGLVWSSCGNKAANQRPAAGPIPVTIEPVSTSLVTAVSTYPGNVVALNETELRAEVSGYVTGIFVQDGAVVSKGQKLYEIDRIRYAASVEQARAAQAIADANIERLERDLKRYQNLAEKDAIARQTLDNALTDLSNAKAQALSSKAALTTAETNLQRSIIYAPFSGTIGISQVRMGALVSAGSTLMNTISSTNPIAIDFPINEKNIQHFIQLQKKGSAGDSSLQILLPGGAVYAQIGKIIAIDRAVNAATGTITVRASFSNPEGLLRAGMNVSLTLKEQQTSPSIVIPNKAVLDQLGSYFVYVVSDSSTAEQRTVTTGVKMGTQIQILSGLKEGDSIITDGIINLRNGAKVVAAP
jgi:membrane fusion protein (multidrug efflux system)